MAGKAQLVTLLERSAKVVEAELALLDLWRNDPETTDGRRAIIDFTANYIGVGFSSALRRTAHALNEAKALPEESVTHPPGSQHGAAVQGTANSVATRVEWPGPRLSDPSFANAMLLARTNSDQSAENSEVIYADCTQAGAMAPAPLVAPRGAAATLLANIRGGGVPARKGKVNKRKD